MPMQFTDDEITYSPECGPCDNEFCGLDSTPERQNSVLNGYEVQSGLRGGLVLGIDRRVFAHKVERLCKLSAYQFRHTNLSLRPISRHGFSNTVREGGGDRQLRRSTDCTFNRARSSIPQLDSQQVRCHMHGQERFKVCIHLQALLRSTTATNRSIHVLQRLIGGAGRRSFRSMHSFHRSVWSRQICAAEL